MNIDGFLFYRNFATRTIYKNMKRDIENRQDIELLIRSFYHKVVKDDTIGYIFNDVARVNWDVHLPIMYNFWENVIFNVVTYRGNPMQLHKELNTKEPLTPEHFTQWLALFTTTVNELFAGAKAELAKQRALSISTMIQVKIAQQTVM